MEMIDFQLNDKFGQDMELIITEICHSVEEDLPNNIIASLEEIKDLEKLIFKRLGMLVKIIANGNLALTTPLYSTNYHIFVNQDYHGFENIEDQEKFLKASNGKSGYVDTKNAKLGGIFSEYKHSLYINIKALVNHYNLSPAQITAILLHELGHCFTNCEYSDRVSTNNQILATIAKEISKPTEKRNSEYVYKQLSKLNPNTTAELVDKIVSGKRVITTSECFKFLMGSVTHQLSNVQYNETQSEAVADIFATRFGYGQQLFTAIEVLGQYGNEDYDKQMDFSENLALSIVCIIQGLLFVLVPVAIPLNIIFGIASIVTGFYFTTLLFKNAGESKKGYTYDDFKIRYKRIRDQIVQEIKLKKYSIERAHQLADKIQFMDKVIKETAIYRTPIDKLLNAVNPKDILAKRSIERQQLLEDLASNELFIQSLRLQILSA